MTLCRRLRERLESWAEGGRAHRGWRAFLVRSLASSLFIASGVHLLHALHAPLEVFPAALMSVTARALAAGQPGQQAPKSSLSEVALAVITPDHFREAYEGTSPLSRCQLAQDLNDLLAEPHLATVAIDLDLSPTLRRGDHETVCQDNLDAVLDGYAQQPNARLILLEPISAQAASTLEDWKSKRIKQGARFAPGLHRLQLGVVSQHVPGTYDKPSLGEALALRIGTLQEADLRHSPGGHPSEPLPIVFRKVGELHGQANGVALDSASLRGAVRAGQVRHLLIGATYSEDDTLLTPIGPLNGVQLHAAIAAEPRMAPGHVGPFLIDLLLAGVVFAGWIHWCWGRYFAARVPEARAGHAAQAAGPSPVAYGWLVLLVAGYAVWTGALTALSASAYAQWGWWINPIPMAIGMALEGFVIGGVETAEHRLAHHGPGHDAPPAPRQRGAMAAVRAALGWVPCVVYVGVVSAALQDVLFHF